LIIDHAQYPIFKEKRLLARNRQKSLKYLVAQNTSYIVIDYQLHVYLQEALSPSHVFLRVSQQQ
jgi:hypothetical protein